jgi:hypothetical protein
VHFCLYFFGLKIRVKTRKNGVEKMGRTGHEEATNGVGKMGRTSQEEATNGVEKTELTEQEEATPKPPIDTN